MDPSLWPELGHRERGALLDAAERSIRLGLSGEGPYVPEGDAVAELPALVGERRGAFVTVKVDEELNGCIGTLEPRDPLIVAVPRLAWEAAFTDPRLPPLTEADEPGLSVKISVLSPLEPLAVSSEIELLTTLRPGVDGLLISAGPRRATFLPAVWEHLGDPLEFLHQLELKAGLVAGRWSLEMKVYRYTAQEFGRQPHRSGTAVG